MNSDKELPLVRDRQVPPGEKHGLNSQGSTIRGKSNRSHVYSVEPSSNKSSYGGTDKTYPPTFQNEVKHFAKFTSA